MADGYIIIDTKLNTSGMNKGTKSIASSLGGVLRSVAKVGLVITKVFGVASIVAFVKSAVDQFGLLSGSVGGKIGEMQTAFEGLKGALAGVVMQLITALAPYIIIVVTWLTKLLTTLSAIIGVLTGVKAGMSGVANETKKTAKAAGGTLAAFDQINVLSQPTDAGGDAGVPALPTSVIPPELLANVEEFKTKFLEFISPVTDALGRLYVALKPLGETIWSGLKWAWDNILVPLGEWVITDLLPAFLDTLSSAAKVLNEVLIALQPVWRAFYDKFLQPLAVWAGGKIIDFLNWLTLKLNELAVWISENPQKFQDFIAIMGILWGVFKIAGIIIAAFGITITGTVLAVVALFAALGVAIYLLITHWEELSTTVSQIGFLIGFYIGQAVEFIKQKFADMWETIKKIWALAGIFFTQYVTDPIKHAFATALDWVSEKFTTIFEGIQSFVKGIINNIIDYINSMIDSVVGGINAVISAANIIGNLVPGFSPISTVSAPQIPRLATGAVIPPNAEFAAILGDQKSGRNIEAPEGLIRQIVSEEIGNVKAEITVNFAGSLAGLVRELKPYIDNENVRIGGSLIKSGATL